LHLPPAALRRLLAELQAQDLVQQCEPGCWCLSERGRLAVAAGADAMPRQERRMFAFVEQLTSTGRRIAPPHVVPLTDSPLIDSAGHPWQIDDSHRFDVARLTAAVNEPAEWRERYGFPAGVSRVVADPDRGWQGVIVNRPERLAVGLVESSDGKMLGFASDMPNWQLNDREPILRLAATARDALPDLKIATAAWAEAWRMWCRQRQLPLSDADACQLTFDGVHLDVRAPDPFVQRLRLSKGDMLRDESALLAGDGYLRAAALLRLHAL
jgi:hypothetical protein